MFGFARVLITLALLVLTATSVRAEKLHSPWDNRRVEQTSVAYECPVAPQFAKTMDLSPYYIDSHASVIDPQKQAAFQKASEPATNLSRFTALAADAYLAKGSRAAATCVYSLLDAAAKAEAWSGKMRDFNGVYIQNWTLSGVAISYLKVRQSGVGTPEQDAEIQRWFALLAARVRTYFDEEAARMGLENGISKENNHIYWAGLAVAAEGIANNDPGGFHWGVEAYRMGIQAIQPDGSLPQEMARADDAALPPVCAGAAHHACRVRRGQWTRPVWRGKGRDPSAGQLLPRWS